ncbi:uncharacterized protein NECHADRAFT_102067 [Fusarium vanettenii 77-13-4]|uniref:B30.2/SPRY domain-containing protein n=1 Tax=Fusarium vanettenii (strain ATCC MYA-4622 / CBS 123669 / FGSC 9596 / NRRL 45880 / 77-13-4) TaxID=660122 RepID=C7ZNG8_FUSV7|nr:uncharacterized protein NECHADRAFT_102067 [Fusarium vanettenii 77-13-4]EEU34422.1 hypothetical protein NECHADRAFT_102067 [Fusarium vanettenii 77-13-4]
MFRQLQRTAGLRLLLIFLMAELAAAADDSEFAFNFFTDIAPLLALFGEQFAAQFLSESLSFEDHIIIAIVPLGILTIIASAIRVQGPEIVRAFIGRARETRAVAELEIMSSTSHDVCELFDGKSIVRVMGRPRIMQLLIFPHEYDMHRGRNESGLISSREALLPLTSLTRSIEEHHDDGFEPIQELLIGLRKRCREFWKRSSPPDDDTAVLEATSGTEGHHPAHPPTEPEPLPPNMQLNLVPDFSKQKEELRMAVAVAIIVQLGLLVLAGVVVFYGPLKDTKNFERKSYGFSCYLIGSLLLSTGIAFCSIAVGNSTDEDVWKARDSDTTKALPRLIWLQCRQSVNDQGFQGYTILAGPKRRIMTSCSERPRIPGGGTTEAPAQNETKPTRSGITNHSVGDLAMDKGSCKTAPGTPWKFLTVLGSLAAGSGFITQFVGLRGLPYPCSIAQLGAIVLMAVIRGFIRRHLSRRPESLDATPEYEIDFLAMKITYCQSFREYEQPSVDEPRDEGLDMVYQWEVLAPKPRSRDLFFSLPQVVSAPSDRANGRDSSNPSTRPPSSQQLLQVRKRLGKLCQWESHSKDASKALAQSVECFMNTFCKNLKNCTEEPEWAIRVASSLFSNSGVKTEDSVFIQLQRPDGEWKVASEQIEAILSLWMATIDARRSAEKQSKKSHTSDAHFGGPRREFYRILGYDFDGVLLRDLSWWVDEGIVEELDDDTGSKTPTRANMDLVIGFHGRSEDEQKRLKPRRSQLEIGYSPNEPRPTEVQERELGLISSGDLPTILAQHLFTSFMWAIAKDLEKNVLDQVSSEKQGNLDVRNKDAFDPGLFSKTWSRPTLQHRQLTNVVRQMESFGLGSRGDILLCMIPALSFQDLLPNRAILTLLPRIAREHRWAETARLYRNLLDTTIRSDPPEQFCYSAVAATVNFLLVANEPRSGVWPRRELASELSGVLWMLKTKFRDMIAQLLPFYHCQGRRNDLWSLLPEETFRKQVNIRHETAEALGISEDHKRMFKEIKDAKDKASRPENKNSYLVATPIAFPRDVGKSSDIFGWKPIHYACCSESEPFWRYLKMRGLQQAPEILNLFEQSPFHLAAAMGNPTALHYLIGALEVERRLEKEQLQQALDMVDINGMTPLHWAAKSGSLECVELITKKQKQSSTRTDIWGRQALHVAVGVLDCQIISQLLETSRWSLKIDKTGWCPVKYLLDTYSTPLEPRSHDAGLDDGSESFGMSSCSEEDTPDWVDGIIDIIDEAEPRRDSLTDSTHQNALFAFERLARRMHGYRDEDGQTFLHLAATYTPICTVERLIQRGYDVEARDSEGQTPLHAAILAENYNVAECLVDIHQADLSAEDYAGSWTLIFAIGTRFRHMIDRILATDCDLDGQDENGRTVLHNAIHPVDPDFSMWLVESLVKKGCDPKIEDLDGRTALHTALEFGYDQVALSLLKPDRVRQTLDNYQDQTLLIAACYGGCHESIPRILELWPSIMSKTDPDFKAPPISWACASEKKAAVQALLQGKDLNMSPDRNGCTPAHYAATATDNDILQLVLNIESVEPATKDGSGLTPIDRAILGQPVNPKADQRGNDSWRSSNARDLLKHRKTSAGTRLEYLKLIYTENYRHLDGIVGDVLERIDDANLDEDTLLKLIDDSFESWYPRSFEAYVRRALTTATWKRIPLPFHRSLKMNTLGLVEQLMKHKADPTGYDGDNWSCLDYATAYSPNNPSPWQRANEELSRYFAKHLPAEHPRTTPMTPSSLDGEYLEPSIETKPCTVPRHSECPGIHQIHMLMRETIQHRDRLRKHRCIISKECVPPLSKSTRYFYFELDVLPNWKSKALRVGFCHETTLKKNQLPGDFARSWGYEGNDGNVYFGDLVAPSEAGHNGGRASHFGAGDTVGVGLDLKTGKRICTLNGRKIDFGWDFRNRGRKPGKMYPCIGYGDLEQCGLGLRVNFSGKPPHLFKYEGPFVS